MPRLKVDWSGDWATPWGSARRGTKAKTITSCDNAFVTNIVLARDPGASNASEAAHRTPPGSFALCESEATATMFYLRESEASATKRPVGTEINPRYDDESKSRYIINYLCKGVTDWAKRRN
ncbi:hypothetical protein ACQKNB_10385 [Lysinibacillus xylanilyticus]|uniref:hypothetical protein n=1 Tax=Lysinibacillus xylanilyticus TaxID=582475 RepID=UPI003D061094